MSEKLNSNSVQIFQFESLLRTILLVSG